MEEDPQIFFRTITEGLNNVENGHYEPLRLLDSFNRNLIEEQIDSALLDLYFPHFFHTSNSLLNFVNASSKIKNFKKACMKAIEILYTVLNNFYHRIPEKDVLSLYTVACRISKSGTESAIKQIFFNLVLKSLEKGDGCMENSSIPVYQDLYNSLIFALHQKNSDTVKNKEMELAGYLAKKYSFIIDDHTKLRKVLWFNFEMYCSLNARKISQYAIAGFYTGFGYFLESYPLNLELSEDRIIVERLYKHMKFLVDLATADRIKLGNRAAISFFGNYTSLFKEDLVKDYSHWHDKLLSWLTCGIEEKKVGATVLKAFYQTVANVLEERNDGCQQIVQYFINYCRRVLNNKEASNYEKRSSIFCLREFASASHKHLPPNEVTEIFIDIMQIFENTFIQDYNPENEEWEFLPDYIQTVANFMKFKEFTASQFFCLQKGTISLMKSFHHISILHHSLVVDALLVTLFYLKTTQYFDTFVENVVYHGVVWSCSHQHISAEALSEDTPQKVVTVKNYFPLWRGVLKLPSNRHYDRYGYYLQDRRYILERIINELVKTLILLVNKLNVSVSLKDEDIGLTDLEKAYKVEESNDYAIFLNVVDFYRDVFENIEPKMLKNCITKLIDHLVSKSLKFPFTSGFYKLLSFCLKITGQLSLFQEDAPGVDLTNTQETLTTFLSVLLNKMAEYKDDLLISCLQVLLETPVEVLEPMITSCIVPFINIFEVGRSYLPLAEVGIDTLEHWQDNLKPEVFDPFLAKVIPSLDTFLRSKFLKGYSTQSVEKKRKTVQALKKRKVLEELEPELVKLQHKILCFIGRQSLKNCQSFIFSDSTVNPTAISGQSSHLKLILPYEDIQLDLYLDMFLPRIIELALYSSDRKTRIISCELLQACVMVFLGRGCLHEITDNLAVMLHSPFILFSKGYCYQWISCLNWTGILFLYLISVQLKKEMPFLPPPSLMVSLEAKLMSTTGLEELNNMLKMLAMPLLLLSCDIDQVVRQIFEPLFLQLIHWYTSPTQTCGMHTSIIIETMLEGITHPTNSGLKDFSGKCINEYVKWSLKHQNLNPEASIKVLVKSMRYFSTHPDPAKKIGAALIFNNIYRELREEQKFVNIFWLELLHIFVLSLDSLNTLEETTTVCQIRQALKHLQRVLMEKPSMFRKLDEKRRIPTDLAQGLLTDVSIWLINQTASNNKHCREACMSLFINLAPLSSEKKLNIPEFIEENLDMTVSSLYDSKVTTFDSLRKGSYTDCASLLHYLRNLLCGLDGYYFIIKNNLETINFDENIFSEIRYFLKNMQTADLISSLNLIKIKTWTFTTLDKDMFVTLKSACTISILKLYNAIIHNQLLCDKGKDLWTNDFWKLVSNALFFPQDLHLNDITHSSYKEVLIILLNAITNKLSKQSVVALRNLLETLIDKQEVSAIKLEKNTTLKQRNFLKGVELLSNSTMGHQIELCKFANTLVERFLQDFYRNASDNIVFVNQVHETTFSYVSTLLTFALGRKNGLKVIIEPCHSDYCVQSIDMMKKISFGLYIVTTFAEAVVPAITSDFGTFLRFSLDCNKKNITLDIINFTLRYISKDKSYKKSYKDIANSLLIYWNNFVEYFNSNDESMEVGVEFLSLFVQICNIGSRDMQDWLVDCLIRRRGNNQLEIFGLLVKIIGDKITEKQSNDLRTALLVLNETLTSQINQDVSTTNFNKMLMFFPIVKSTIIFQYLVDTYLNIPASVEIGALIASFIKGLDKNLQGVFLQLVYDMNNDTFEKRYKIGTDIIPVMFQNCDQEAFEQFFVNNIQNILKDFEEHNMENCIINFVFIGILFLRIPIGSPERTYCPIAEASQKPKLVATLLNYVLDAFKSVEIQNELTRKYKCHAYNALASMVSNSLKKPAFYEKLFIRQSNGADILWHGIINTDIMYNFPRQFDTLPTKKKILVNIRDELRQARRKTGSMSKSLQYIESVRLFNSSLSEDVTKFDFTNSILRSERHAEKKMVEYLHVQSEVYLEITEINKHECMGTICSLIQHIFESGMSELPSEGDDDIQLPNWLNGIRSLLLDPKTHINVKIFLVKVIDNKIEIFNRFAKYFLEPLIQFVVDKCAGDSINYFVTDALVIISKWASEIPNLSETESRLASKLLEHFIKNIEKGRQDVFKYNIELLKLIVEAWKNHLTAPTNTIFEMLSSEETSETAIYVCSVLLVNNLEVWQRGDEHQFLDLILNQLSSSKRPVYRACSETLGPLLSMLKADEFIDKVNARLRRWTQPSELEKFAICLEGIAIKFPQIVNKYHVARLISSFNQVPVVQKVIHLKIINRRLEFSLDVLEKISEFQIVEWHQLIENSNLEIQILALEIIRKSLSVFSTYPNFDQIIKTLGRNLQHPNPTFRGCLYDTVISLYNLHKEEDACKEILIIGLVDADLDNQNKIIDFWAQNIVLYRKVIDRFSFFLSEMYKTKIEDKLLGFSTYLLLRLLNESEKYDLEIFEHPLEDCDFEEYKLQTNWRLQHPSVVPMFAETLDINSLESSSTFDADQDVFLLRKTQTNFEFTPTQSYHEQQLSKFTSLESSLGVDIDTSFKDPNGMQLSQKYKINKRRFLNDKAKISRNMAQIETQKQIKKVRDRIESAIEREKKVTIYRSYRKGDFPDIQIALSAILKPLQILALYDSEISKLLFLEIFKGLASKIENNKIFLATVSDGIKNIFKTSVQFNRYLFTALLDILLKNRDTLSFDPSLIAYVAQESGLASIGALLLEEYIISGDDGPSTSKKKYQEEDYGTICWIKLAELYKNLEEWDTVKSIFLEKMDHKESVQKALTFESKSMYGEAIDFYKELVETDQSVNKKDFYYESYFNCFANLGKWEEIPNAIGSVVENENTWKGLWDDDWCKQKLLPWYITSHVRTQLFKDVFQKEFIENLNECLTDPKHCDYLTSNFAEELCVLWLCQNDLTTANQYLKTAIKSFLEDWQNLNPMFQALRYQKLLKLQNIIEIADFIKIYGSLTDDIDKSLTKLTDRWSRGKNDVPPSVLFSETKLLYRRQFINTILDKLTKLEGSDLRRQIKDIHVAKVRMDVNMITTAAEFGNFYITRKYLRDYMNNDNEKLNIAKGTVNILKAKMVNNESDKMNFYLQAVSIFGDIANRRGYTSSHLKTTTKLFDVLIDISQLVANHPELLSKYRQKLATSLNTTGDLQFDVEKYAFNLLKTATETCNIDAMDTETDENEKLLSQLQDVSNAYIKLAHFIHDKQNEEMQGNFILFVLRAMRLNSSEARQLFPCILMQSNLGTLHKELFIDEVKRIPTWMFLGWIPQLLANVDSTKVSTISALIIRITETYPQAIMYPYRLSKENYSFDDANVSRDAKKLTDQLDKLLLNDEHINKFLKALSYVSLPANILRYYIAKINKNKENKEIIRKHIQTIQADVFDIDRGPNINNLQGNIFKKIEKYKREFSKFSNKDITGRKVEELCKRLDSECEEILKTNKTKPSQLLKDYCPWLDSFSANKLNMELEIPGQYDGRKLPLPQNHVKISGFKPNVRIMESLRKPIKITMLGMNNKEYPFLLKFGEDIRQDQRIEQLFGIMNDLLSGDSSCSNNGLDILSYQVIPLTSSLGLIQWVEDTQPLFDIIKKPLKSGREEKQFDNIDLEYERNLKRRVNSHMVTYGEASVKITKDRVTLNFQTLVRKVPWDILRTSFWMLSTSTENYIALRNNFIKTYAVICTIHWILGIGDRHLTNSLICLRSGKVLGIDFGHAFGTATQILPVPELVPFRLTPHLIGLMEPLRERGPFREYMIHCLRCLRANNLSLLSTMHVFIREPSLDWLEHAAMTDDSQVTDPSNSASWYPVVKIEQAKRKLKGANPADIMTEELRDGSRNQSYTDAFIKHVRGETGQNLRADFAGRADLSVEEQVDCLIDQATDYNLLGRMWIGWKPWI